MRRLLSSRTLRRWVIAVFSMAIISGCLGSADAARNKPATELVVTITPSNVKITDNSKRGTRLATVAVRRSDGAPFKGKLTLTNNPGRICQLVGMEVQLGRDATKADDYTTSVCTVTASH
jgi:hypothetical protein